MKIKKGFIVWLLFWAFGIPSVGGTGLHLFLPTRDDEESLPNYALFFSGGGASDFGMADLPEHQSVRSKRPHNGNHCFLCHEFSPVLRQLKRPHNENQCFLCHFLGQAKSGNADAAVLDIAIPIIPLSLDGPSLVIIPSPIFYSGRSPPSVRSHS